MQTGLRTALIQFSRTVLGGYGSSGLGLPVAALEIAKSRETIGLAPEVDLCAVPKKKISHSRKRMRAANKGLQNINHIMVCPGCTQPKLRHHRCQACGFFSAQVPR
jgi:ribosomal protein L32